eukprot:3541278-Amphidinium_carterae.1
MQRLFFNAEHTLSNSRCVRQAQDFYLGHWNFEPDDSPIDLKPDHAAIDRGTVTAADHHGNGQTDLLANQGTSAHSTWAVACVARHAAFLQHLECGRQTGKVKGEYPFSYLKGQDCRKLFIRRKS